MPILTSAVDRPLALRLRPDLVASPVEMGGTTTWIMKDPITLEHFQFTAEEYALVDRLRQAASLGDLERAFAQAFPPQTITPGAIWSFLSRLYGAGLLVADGAGQGDELLAQMRRDRLRRYWLAWTQLLAMRFRGIDPNALLTKLHDGVAWILNPATTLLLAIVVLYAGSIAFGRFDEFTARLPQLSALADVRNVLWLLAAIGVVKVLHEFGHALACKHYGGDVHEMGFMLLAFSPCLYCDVTDAWRFSSKWQRIVVSGAGMMVELVLASVATIVWWHSQEGLVNLMALHVMVVCTVGTLAVNGNPLLRYDGYYILSDLVEVPNLWQRSREALRKLAFGWLSDDAVGDDPLLPAAQRAWLAAYAMASKAYVALVCVMVVWGLVVLLYPLRLQNLAYGVGLTVLASALVGPITSAARLAKNPTHRAEVQRRRLAVFGACSLLAMFGVLAIPVSYYVRAPLVVMPANAARVYATVEGTLTSAVSAGEQVSAGATIAELANSEVAMELERLAGDRRSQELRLTHLERLRGIDAEANDQIPAARAALADLEHRLEDRKRDAARLTLTAPIGGTIIPTPRTPTGDTTSGRLATWSGSILDANNRGARVEAGTLVCLVGDPTKQTALLLVDDGDVKRLRPGQAVRMRIDQLPGQVLVGTVVDVARHEVRDAQSDAASRADLTSLLAGIVTPGDTATRYQVRVKFDDEMPNLIVGGRGSGKIGAERITLARWIVRFLGQTFRLPM